MPSGYGACFGCKTSEVRVLSPRKHFLLLNEFIKHTFGNFDQCGGGQAYRPAFVREPGTRLELVPYRSARDGRPGHPLKVIPWERANAYQVVALLARYRLTTSSGGIRTFSGIAWFTALCKLLMTPTRKKHVPLVDTIMSNRAEDHGAWVKTNTTVTRIKGHIGKIPYASCRLFSDASTCFRGTTDRNLCRHVSSGARTFPCGSFGRVPPERGNYRTFRLYHHVRLFLFPWHVRAQACTRIDAGTMRSDDVREKGADREMHPITKEDKGHWSGFWPHDLRILGSTRTLLSRDCFSVGKRRQSRHGRSCAFRFHPA